MILLELFLTFLKIGAISFGGGYGMIPVIREEVLKHGWMTEEQLLNFIAVAESTPGPIAVNISTFIGATQGGLAGAVLATLGAILPAFLIILTIAIFIRGVLKYAGVQAVLTSIRPVITAMILATSCTIFLSTIFSIKSVNSAVDFDWRGLIIFGVIFIGATLTKRFAKKTLSPMILIIISAALGMLLYSL